MFKLLKYKVILLILGGLGYGTIFYAQEFTRTEIKAAYIFQIPQYIVWGESFQNQEEFKIGILGSDAQLEQTLKELSEKTRILNKPVQIKTYNFLKKIDTVNILCISENWTDRMNDISQSVSGKETLLITDSYADKTFIMINFIDKENRNLEFEVNKANILLEKLNIYPKLLFIGGTEIDISELFDATLDSLKKAKNDIFQKQTELENINSRLLKKEQDLQILNEHIILQQQNSLKRDNELSRIESELLKMQNQYTFIKDSMNIKENEYNQQQKDIQKQKQILSIQLTEIEKQNNEIIQQQEEINSQKGTLEAQKNKLNTQKILIIIIAVMLMLTIAMIFVTTRQIIISKKTNLELQNQNLQVEHQALEIKLQSRELKKQAVKLKEQSAELKQQNEILQQKRNHLRALIDNIPDFIYIKDTKSRFTNANIKLVNHLGLKHVDDIMEKTDFDFYDKELATQFFDDEIKIFKTGKPLIKKEEPGIDRDGNIMHMQTTKVPVRDSVGNIINIVGIGRDVTNEKIAEVKLKKQAETLKVSNALLEDRSKKIEKLNDELQHSNKKLEDLNKNLIEQKEELQATLDQLKLTQNQLVQSEKMASLGILTAGIAHEINNPVNFVYAGVNSVKKDFDDLTPVLQEIQKLSSTTEAIESKLKTINALKEEYEFDLAFEAIPDTINDIKLGASRIIEIVASLSKLSRLETDEWHISDIHEEIESVLVLLKNKYKRNIEIEKNYNDNIPQIECNPGKMNQVFMNIISNAIDAIGDENGKIKITTILNGKKVKISIKDTGKGISDEVKSKIFDPFFTTKDVGKGIGLGLSITYSIIEEHSGQIYVNTLLGEGTEFVIEIPIKQNKKINLHKR